MNVTPLELPDVLVLEPRVFEDDRGFFFESFNARTFAEATGVDAEFVQDNHSRSSKGVLRGLHYQVPPRPQAKLVRVTKGSVFDVAVDIRRSSPTFGRWVGAELSATNHLQLWIPVGFAHGFVALEEGAEVLYKTTGYYSPECDRSIAWNDPAIGVDWPTVAGGPILSAKDAQAPLLEDADVFESGKEQG